MSDENYIESEQEVLSRISENPEVSAMAELETLGVAHVAKQVIPDMRPRLKVKRLTSTALLPTRADELSVGYDIHADLLGGNEIEIGPNVCNLAPGMRKMIPTGIGVGIPVGFYGRLAPRSGLAKNFGISVMGGVIDPGFGGQVMVILHNAGDEIYVIHHNDRICQMILEQVSTLEIEEVDMIAASVRGVNGFGSSGV